MSGGLSVTTEFTPHKRSKGHWMQMDMSRYLKKHWENTTTMAIYLFRIKLGAIFQKTSKWLDDHHIDYLKDLPKGLI